MATIDLTMGTAVGDFVEGEPFTFTMSSATTNVVTITGRSDQGGDKAWFTSDPYPAEIPIGSSSVTATPTETISAPHYFTYLVTGINVNSEAHVTVSSSMPGRMKKAS